MALLVWVIYNFVGIKKQGLFGYFKTMLFPPGVPKAALHPGDADRVRVDALRPAAVAVRPALRQHARRPPAAGQLRRASPPRCGHSSVTIVIWPFSFGLLVGLTGFEVLVAVLQAFIFTILTAVYIGGAMHPEH